MKHDPEKLKKDVFLALNLADGVSGRFDPP